MCDCGIFLSYLLLTFNAFITLNGDLNQYRIIMVLFGAAHDLTNKGKTILYRF